MAAETKSEPVYPAEAKAYNLYQEIGRGAFARVYRGAVKATEEPVAIKLITLNGLIPPGKFAERVVEIRDEVQVMKAMRHPNIVSVHSSFIHENALWMVMPLLGAGSLHAIIKKHFPDGIKDEVLIATILNEVLKGLKYLHEDRRIHRDIKAGNILVSSDGEIMLGDFGVAASLNNAGRDETRQTFTGTPCWMAPEVMQQTEGYDTRADIWSLGITALELAFGKPPYHDYKPMKVLLTVLRENPPTCQYYDLDKKARPKNYVLPSAQFSRSFKSMLEKCLKKKAKKRPRVVKLMTHRFFEKAKGNEYVKEHLLKDVKAMPKGGVPLNTEDVSGSEGSGSSVKEDQPTVFAPTWIPDSVVVEMEELEKMKKQLEEGDSGAGGDSDGEDDDDEYYRPSTAEDETDVKDTLLAGILGGGDESDDEAPRQVEAGEETPQATFDGSAAAAAGEAGQHESVELRAEDFSTSQ